MKLKVYKVKSRVGRKTVSITFPRNIIEDIAPDKKKIFFTVINGVIQISGNQPNIFVPAVKVNKKDFEPQI
jgi:hypothetical protein